MITVRYAPNSDLAVAVPDGRVKVFVDNLIECHKSLGKATAMVSTSLVLDELRFRVALGVLPDSEVVFKNSTGDDIRVNRFGTIQSGPTYHDYYAEVSGAIISAALSKKKQEKEDGEAQQG